MLNCRKLLIETTDSLEHIWHLTYPVLWNCNVALLLSLGFVCQRGVLTYKSCSCLADRHLLNGPTTRLVCSYFLFSHSLNLFLTLFSFPLISLIYKITSWFFCLIERNENVLENNKHWKRFLLPVCHPDRSSGMWCHPHPCVMIGPSIVLL